MTNAPSVQTIRAQYENQIITTPGVAAVSTCTDKDGKLTLLIRTSHPTEEVRNRLPEEIFQIPVALEYIGQINAQKKP